MVAKEVAMAAPNTPIPLYATRYRSPTPFSIVASRTANMTVVVSSTPSVQHMFRLGDISKIGLHGDKGRALT